MESLSIVGLIGGRDGIIASLSRDNRFQNGDSNRGHLEQNAKILTSPHQVR
jgi:hypothetical protein